MWLDRLSAYSTPGVTPTASPPSPANRPHSPAPRRPSHLTPASTYQRPGFSPRSSSLSLNSNDSTSLLASSRRSNGSGLKQSTTVVDAADPLEVLDGLLHQDETNYSKTSRDKTGARIVRYSSVDLFEGEVDFGGVDLRDLVTAVGESSEASRLCDTQTVGEYERERDKLEDLHRSIRACDDVLHSVETNLTSFQNDLAAVSAEIETLQARSTTLSTRLENRRQVESSLGPVVDEISVSPSIVRKIVEGTIDDVWVRALSEVEKRFKVMQGKSAEQKNIRGFSDIAPLLENLINKALERTRDFMVAQIKALRSPNINAQIIQQQHFIRYKDLYTFLHQHHPQLAEEIGRAYTNTMRWYFLNQFTRYHKAIEKIRVHILDKHDVLGQDDGGRKSSMLSATKSSGPPHDAFNLGRRIDILKTPNQTALSSFLVEEDKMTHYIEFPFRNFNLALVDNASAEYSFLTSFFSPALSLAAISRYFNYIFEPVFTLGRNLSRSLTLETFDCLGLLICVRLNQHLAFELQRRKIPVCDGYINATSMLLWPRFQIIMDQHCESVRSVTANVSLRKQTASEQAKQSAAPHFITQRFGQFMQGILSLSTEGGDDEPVSTSLNRLRNEVDAFLMKTSKNIRDTQKRERFLYNNYSLILTIIGDVDGKQALDQQEYFENLKMSLGVDR